MLFYIILEWITNWLCKKSHKMSDTEIAEGRQKMIDAGTSPEEVDALIKEMRDSGTIQ